MTYDEAVSKARNEANRQRREMVVYSTLDPNKRKQYGCCPGSWSMDKSYTVVSRVDPTFRHWNGSRVIETQAVVPYVTDPELGLVKAQQREYQA